MTAPFTPEDELERLLQLLYQCPVGLLVLEPDWSVEMVNPAAVRLLAPAVRRCTDPGNLVRALELLVPDLRAIAAGAPDNLGRLHAGRRIVAVSGAGCAVEVIMTQVENERLMVTLLDATPDGGR